MAIEEKLREDRRNRAAAVLRDLVPLISIGAIPDAMLDSVAMEFETIRERLAPYSRIDRVDAGLDAPSPPFVPGLVRRLTHPVFGEANASSPPMVISFETEIVVGKLRFGAAFEGPHGCAHGGWIASAFDCVMGQVARRATERVLTGRLTTRYLRPVPLHQEARIAAELLRHEGRRIEVKAELRVAEAICAEATALFVAVKI